MRTAVIILLLLPATSFAGHATVDVTPESIQKYGLDVNIQVIEQTIKEGDKPARVTGHQYRLRVESKKLDLRNFQVVLYLKVGKDSYLHAALQRNLYALKNGDISCDVSFSPDYLDNAALGEKPWPYRNRCRTCR